LNSNNKTRRGAAAVELAFVLPVFLLVIFGIVEFGRAFMAEHLLANAARLGARSAIVEGSTNAEITQQVTDFCVDTLSVNAADVSVFIEDQTGTAIDLSTTTEGDLCRVRVAVPFDSVSFLTGSYMTGAALDSSCIMEHE
jgi:Flp pilus assembly protein TadG